MNNWRDSIIKTIEYLFIKDYPYGIPSGIINAIDSAYVQGLEDGKKEAEISNGINNSKLY